MHEFSLIADLIKKIETVAAANKGQRVVTVKVRLGALSHISASHFREHFQQASPGTLAAGARLEIEEAVDINDPLAQQILLQSVELE